MNPFINKQCREYSKGELILNLSQIEEYRRYTPQWQFCASENKLSQTFHFNDYHQTMAFVNAIAAISHRQNHHPDMQVSYNRCKVCYKTHSVNGLTENDFICATLIDQQLS